MNPRQKKSSVLGEYLKSIREADELSQAGFARKLKISTSSLKDIEKGKYLLTPHRAIQFSRLLNLPDDKLIRLLFKDVLRQSKARVTRE